MGSGPGPGVTACFSNWRSPSPLCPRQPQARVLSSATPAMETPHQALSHLSNLPVSLMPASPVQSGL